MGRKPKNSPDDLDILLLDAQRISADKGKPGASLPSVPISKRVMEFAQFFGAIKYRDMREMLSILAKCKKLEEKFFQIAEDKLPFKPDNWAFFFLKGHSGIDPPGFIPEVLEKGRGLVARVDEMKHLLETDENVRRTYDDFEACWWSMDSLNYRLSEWIREQFHNGSLEGKILGFKNEKTKKTMLSKGFASNLMIPGKAEVVKKTGELPDLSIGERQALQFLLGKLQNMTDREKYLKKRLLEDEDEDPKKHGFFVVFEQTEALRQSYGNIRFDGYHYQNLEKSLGDLLEKKRKLLIETAKDTLELSLTLIQKLEMRHKFHEDPEFRSYVAVRIPYDVAKLHDKKYTSYPDDHFALLRNTPPKTVLGPTEIRLFDFLQSEAPHKPGDRTTVRRIKGPFLAMIGGNESIENNHQSRLAERIEQTYLVKAINMNLLKGWHIEANSDREEVYVFEYPPKQKRKQDC